MLTRIELWKIPSRNIGVDTIMERRVVSHLGRQRTQQVTYSLLLFNIDIKISDHYDAALGADAFLTAAELTRCHIGRDFCLLCRF